MSIAVSALVRPSLPLCLLRVTVCAGVIVSALVCPGWGWAVLCVAAGVAGLPWRGGNPKPRRIDISPVGQIRLTVYQQRGQVVATSACTPQPAAAAVPVAQAPLVLLAGSTLWPRLLLLRLGTVDGPVRELLVLPGCVAGPAFRPLALACRAVAARASGMADGT
jgi:hypothetical protein